MATVATPHAPILRVTALIVTVAAGFVDVLLLKIVSRAPTILHSRRFSTSRVVLGHRWPVRWLGSRWRTLAVWVRILHSNPVRASNSALNNLRGRSCSARTARVALLRLRTRWRHRAASVPRSRTCPPNVHLRLHPFASSSAHF